MEDRAQGGKKEGKDVRKREGASTNYHKSEESPIGEALGLVPNRRSTCVP